MKIRTFSHYPGEVVEIKYSIPIGKKNLPKRYKLRIDSIIWDTKDNAIYYKCSPIDEHDSNIREQIEEIDFNDSDFYMDKKDTLKYDIEEGRNKVTLTRKYN